MRNENSAEVAELLCF